MRIGGTGRIAWLVAMCIVAALIASAPARADQGTERAARAVVATLVAEAHAAMSAADRDAAARRAALEQAIADAFAFDVWERFLLGDRDLTAEERARFRALLPGFLARLYARQFGKGLEAEPRIVGTRAMRGDVLVAARIPRADGEPLPVEYRVRPFDERGPLVIDLMVGGVSFLLLKRDEFGALLESDGVEGLLTHMRGEPD